MLPAAALLELLHDVAVAEECEEQKARRCLQPGPFNSCGEAGGAGGDRPAAGVLEDSNGR